MPFVWRQKNSKTIRFCFGLLCFIPHLGCVSIQRNLKPGSVPFSTQLVSDSNGNDSQECQLYDRREVWGRIGQRLNPVPYLPSRLTDWATLSRDRTNAWMCEQRTKCAATKQSFAEWKEKKKEEANQPPWPRFHPVPTKPVFEPDELSPQIAPEILGQFGKN